METEKPTIPPRHRPEWRDIVTLRTNHTFKNFVLQMKSSEYSRKIAADSISVQKAADEMYELCLKYSYAVAEDMKAIFKQW